MPQRRGKGDDALYQRCDERYGCPPAEWYVDDRGKRHPQRPKHKCRGSWYGAVELGDKNGKRDRKTVSARTKTEAARKLDKVREQIAATGTAPTNIPTLEKWLNYWLDEIAVRRVVPSCHRGYRSQIDAHLVPHLGRKRVDQLEPTDVLRLHKILRGTDSQRRAGKKLAEGSVLRAHVVLSKALDDAHRLGYVTRNVAKLVDRPGTGWKPGTELDADQAAQLLAHVATAPFGSRWAFALLTGQRQGETLGLRWSHVDFDEATLDIAWQLQRVAYRHGCTDDDRPVCGAKTEAGCPVKQLDVRRDDYEYEQLHLGLCLVRPKRQKRKMIPLIPALERLLERHRHQFPPGQHDLVWARSNGQPINPKDDRQNWYRLLEQCQLPRVRPHSARRSVVSLLSALGVPIIVTQQIVGHSRPETTLLYKNEDLTQARKALEQLGTTLQLPQLH